MGTIILDDVAKEIFRIKTELILTTPERLDSISYQVVKLFSMKFDLMIEDNYYIMMLQDAYDTIRSPMVDEKLLTSVKKWSEENGINLKDI